MSTGDKEETSLAWYESVSDALCLQVLSHPVYTWVTYAPVPLLDILEVHVTLTQIDQQAVVCFGNLYSAETRIQARLLKYEVHAAEANLWIGSMLRWLLTACK